MSHAEESPWGDSSRVISGYLLCQLLLALTTKVGMMAYVGSGSDLGLMFGGMMKRVKVRICLSLFLFYI